MGEFKAWGMRWPGRRFDLGSMIGSKAFTALEATAL